MKHKTIIKELKTSYSKVGLGKPIILIHGWGCDLSIFNQLQNELAKTHEVFAIDLPGFGMTEVPQDVWNVENYADFLKEFIRSQNISDPILLGHSFGGKISMQYASKNKVSKLVLTGSAGVKPNLAFKTRIKVFALKFFKKIIRLLFGKKKSESIIESYRKKIGSIDYRAANGTMRKILVKSVSEDLTGIMHLIQAKTLILWGKNDNETPLSAGQIIDKFIPNTEFKILENAGHYPFLDQEEEFIIHLSTFLDEN